MGSTRVFLADLPTRTSEADLHSLFQDYGHVEHVDLKRKEQDGSTKVIAFVTLQTEDAQYCVNELNWQKLHGAKLRVSLAKESFLDRLKREREENQRREQGDPAESDVVTPRSQLLDQSNQNKRRVFGEDEEIGDDEIAPELLITKKRAAQSMQNGKIVIQKEHDVKPLHVIEQHRKVAKQQLDAKVSQAEQKRMESLNKMRQGHQQKKSAIQQALSAISVDGGQAKRIKFSDAEEEEAKPVKKSKEKKRNLFEGDDDEEEEPVVLPQHKGKKGERLVEMQSKQSLDPRFRITSNFVDEGEDAEMEDAENQSEPEESERKWQMNILEQVVGHKISGANDNDGKPAKSKKMLRFDPAKEDHQKLMRQKQPKEEEEKQEKIPSAKDNEHSNAPSYKVSQKAFYILNDNLKDALNTRSEGFSMLNMFGSDPQEELAKRQDQLEKLGQEKILLGKPSATKLGLGTLNPFSYDSSDSEDETQPPKENQELEVSKENQAQPVKKSSQKKNKIKMESFFIPKNDARLKEGAKFFKSAKPEVEHADYDQVKGRLKLLISNKIAKTRKNQPSKDIRQYRNKKTKS